MGIQTMITMRLREQNPKRKGAIVNRTLYKQAGNSICVPIFEAIFDVLFREIIKEINKVR